MPYTVWSNGRLVGETVLDFPSPDARVRSGWLVFSERDEDWLEVIAAPPSDMRAYLLEGAAARQPDGEAPCARRTTAYADAAEELQRQVGLGLELHREDGQVVPVERIGLEDRFEVHELPDDTLELEPPPGDEVPLMLEMLDAGPGEGEMALPEPAMWMAEWFDDIGERWSRQQLDGVLDGMRFSVHVLLADACDLPPVSAG